MSIWKATLAACPSHLFVDAIGNAFIIQSYSGLASFWS